jgi:hypothetical protein
VNINRASITLVGHSSEDSVQMACTPINTFAKNSQEEQEMILKAIRESIPVDEPNFGNYGNLT